MTPPPDPIAAVTHPDPYPYYAELVAHRPLYRDDTLGLWVASSAAAVTAVLVSELGRVRPPSEPVPAALLGSPAAEIFRHLARMTDGAAHAARKQAVSATLQPLDAARIAAESERWARRLVESAGPRIEGAHLTAFTFDLPVHVVGSLLGIPTTRLRETAQWMSDFVGCLAPASTPGQIARGKDAAGHLLELGRAVLRDGGDSAKGLLATLARGARRAGLDEAEAILANGIGFMSQAYEATAGLIGNTLLALAARPALRESMAGDPRHLPDLVREVLRFDPPIQNTRRFLAAGGRVAGHEMAAGDAVLVVLAAANRDPLANFHPEVFDPLREDRRLFTFGVGPHACPGEQLAVTIATAGVAALLAAGLDVAPLAGRVSYRSSANARIPLFG
jgi:cytochrome P450